MSEGLRWSFIKYQDNQSCLDLIEGSPLSVFSLLDEVHSCSFLEGKQRLNTCQKKFNLSYIFFRRRVVSIGPPNQGHFGFVWRRSSARTPT